MADDVEIEIPRSFATEPKSNYYDNGSNEPDPFLDNPERMRGLTGLSPASKRRMTRGLEKGNQGVGGEAKSKKYEYQTYTGYLLMDVVRPPFNLEYLAKLYEKSAPHQAAIRAKSSNIVGLGFDLILSEKAKQTEADLTDQDAKDKLNKRFNKVKEDVLNKIENCNDDDDFLETLNKVWIDYEATGNGYFEIGRKVTGEIGYIGHIPSTTMRLRKDRDGYVQLVSDRVTFFRKLGDDKTVDPLGKDPNPNEVIHIKKYTPTNGYYGVPDVIAAQQALAGEELAGQYNLDYFENKAVPRYVIISKGANLSATAQQRITEFFETRLRGSNHRTIYVPLPADTSEQKVDFEMKAVENGTQDASFVNYHKINIELILMAHRVPPTKAGIADGTALAAARDMDKTFKEQVCRPEQAILQKKLNKIIREFTNMFTFKLNELSLTDEDQQSQIDERDIRNNIKVANEVRAERGLPPRTGGDKTAADINMQTASATKVNPVAQQAADAKATAGQTRTRDAARSAGATDSKGQGRNSKGDGRKVA